MKSQMIRKNVSLGSPMPGFATANSTTKNRRLGISATVLCLLAIALLGGALPGAAETVTNTGNYVGGAATGTVGVVTSGFGYWNGLPQNNPNQITVNSNSTSTGQFYTFLNFTQNPSTEYGLTWNMTNSSGQNWDSMHFTLQYAPLGDFSVTFDQTGLYPSQPNGSPWSLPYNWTDTNVDFSGAPISGSGGTASFYLPLDINGACCSGNFIVFATPDYTPSTPEPSSLLLFGSGIIGIGGVLRRRYLG